jgi:hypothetical protein
MRMPPAAAILPLVAAGLALASCGACDDPARDVGRDDAGCTYETCAASCAAGGRCYGSCGAGTCHCTSCTPDADADGDADRGGHADADGDDAREADVPADIETREGGSPGVLCRRVPTEIREMYATPAGSGSRVAFPQLNNSPMGRVWWIYSIAPQDLR